MTLSNSRGPIIPMLRRSHTIYTITRRHIWPEFSSARCSTVRPRRSHPRDRRSMLTPFVRLILGTVVVLFFRCMTALLDPVHRRGERIKWGLVSYTVITFSFATVLTAMDLHIESISYIDNREFPGIEDVLPPGPVGYQWLISPKAVNVVPNFMFNLSNWLTDALLVSFCSILRSLIQASNTSSSRFIVAMLSTP